MFGRKEKPKRPNRPAGSLAQFGLIEVPDNLDDIGNLGDDDDGDLEAELAALTLADDNGQKARRKAPPPPVHKENLGAMIAESMKDINFEEDVSDTEDDPDLLSELKMITGDESSSKNSPEEPDIPEDENLGESGTVKHSTATDDTIKLLQERLALYLKAEERAKEHNEGAKARRYNRGVKTLQELLHNAETGRVVNEADIPPLLPPSATTDVKPKPSEPVEDTTPMPTSEVESQPEPVLTDMSEPKPATVDQEILTLLKNRQQEYKIAALTAKKSGSMKEAIQYLNIYKQFEKAIAAANEGAVIDATEIPPPPSALILADNSAPPEPTGKEEAEVQQNTAADTPTTIAPTEPQDLGTALKERLEIYRRTKTAAETEGNSSKARRYGRICKQFEDAIKLHTRGKPVPLDELPTPPGFPPLTNLQLSAASTTPTATPTPTVEPSPPSVSPKKTAETDEGSPEDSSTTSPRPAPRAPPVNPQPGARRANQKITSRAEKQLAILSQRAHELKQAALAAKKDGDLELARDYLRQAKGIQPLIEASKAGLPVDMNSIPLSPLAKIELDAHNITPKTDDNFTLVYSEDCVEESGMRDDQIYENLETQLVKQIKWCLSTRDHHKALGDVSGYNRWERLALGYTRDLDMLRVRKRDALPPPQHHYETKTYAIVQSCTDLSDGDIEISIIRGVNYSKEADTYVIWQFPYPSDNSPTDRTSTVKGSCNPEYESVFPLSGIIDRNSRQCQRTFKRHALKCQVWAKGGFFRSDNLVGTVSVKLQPLETKCTLHDSFPLMDGRKPSGGKLELKIRLRNPILTKQIEQITDRWLTIDH